MRATNSKKEKNNKSRLAKFMMIFSLAVSKGKDDAGAHKDAYLGAYYHGSPIYIPRVHNVMSPATQQRNAKARRRTKNGCNKS